MSQLEKAIEEFRNRRNRTSHPKGKIDNGGRWYPSETEKCDCCKVIREPSRAYPWSLMIHCRTMRHVANLFSIKLSDMKKGMK